jgi:hypothetical protein
LLFSCHCPTLEYTDAIQESPFAGALVQRWAADHDVCGGMLGEALGECDLRLHAVLL